MKIVLTILGLCFLIGCSTATPPTVVKPTSVPTASTPSEPTAAAEPTATLLLTHKEETPVDVAAIFEPVASALAEYQSGEGDPEPLQGALVGAVFDFIDKVSDPNMPLPGQPVLDALVNALAALKLPEQVKPGVAAIHLRDSEGGSEDLLLVSLENMRGLPVIGMHRLGTSYINLQLSGPELLANEQGAAGRNFSSGRVQGADLTGDGVGEAIYTYIIPGASAVTQELHVARWDEHRPELQAIFQATLVSWAGESKYTLVPGDKGQNLRITYPWFGVFDHKMTEHPQAAQVWAYDPAEDRLVKQSETIDPAKTVRQQLNVAEQLFRQGEWDKAVTEYERAWKDTTLTEESFGDNKPATRAFARLRQAQVLALLGQTAAARTAATDAQKAGGDVGKLAGAFLKNVTGSDPGIRAWAALPAGLDLYESIYQGKSNLDIPANATDIFFKGEIAAAFLDAHPNAGPQLANALAAVGFKPAGVASADLDGDGKTEYLMVTQEGTTENPLQSLWLIYRGQKRWLARSILQETTLTLGAIVPVPDSNMNAIRIKLPPNTQPAERVLTWTRYYVLTLDPMTLEQNPGRSPWPVFGDGNTDSEF